MNSTTHRVDFVYTRQELEALFRYAHENDVEKGGHYDARSAAVNLWSHGWQHPATREEPETIGTFYFRCWGLAGALGDRNRRRVQSRGPDARARAPGIAGPRLCEARGCAPGRAHTMTQPSYDTDFYPWTQAQALRAKDWAALDVGHLAEEMESLGQSDRYAIESQLVRLLLHLLTWQYDPATRPCRGWRLTIEDVREEIARRARGGLRGHPAAYLPEAYRCARRKAAMAMERPLPDFPEQCPWPIEAVLEEDWLPSA